MITQCSHCSTKFEISTELVESDDPRVRCGECLSVFNARLQIVPEPQFVEQPDEPVIPTVTQKAVAAKGVVQTAPAAELESYITADDLENAATIVLDEPSSSGITGNTAGVDEFYSPDLQIGSHKPASFDSGGSLLNSTTLEFERTMLIDEQRQSDIATADTLQSNDSVSDLSAAGHTMDDMPSVELHDSEITDANIDQDVIGSGALPASDAPAWSDESAVQVRKHVNQRGGEVVPLVDESDTNRKTQNGSMLVPLLTCALALAGVLYLARDQIAGLKLPEPVLSSFCALTGCELPVQQDLSRLELLGHKLNSHPTLNEVLVIQVDLINNAPFPQPYPVLAVGMKNDEGEIVADRRFQPQDYLEADALDSTLPVGRPERINFEILDPGPQATKSVVVFE